LTSFHIYDDYVKTKLTYPHQVMLSSLEKLWYLLLNKVFMNFK